MRCPLLLKLRLERVEAMFVRTILFSLDVEGDISPPALEPVQPVALVGRYAHWGFVLFGAVVVRSPSPEIPNVQPPHPRYVPFSVLK